MNKLSKEEVDTIMRGFEVAWKLCDTHTCFNCPLAMKPEGSVFPQCMCSYSITRNIDNFRKHLEDWGGDNA